MGRETMRKLVRIWDQAGPEFEAIKRREPEALNRRLILRELKPLLQLRETPENRDKRRQLRRRVEKGA